MKRILLIILALVVFLPLVSGADVTFYHNQTLSSAAVTNAGGGFSVSVSQDLLLKTIQRYPGVTATNVVVLRNGTNWSISGAAVGDIWTFGNLTLQKGTNYTIIACNAAGGNYNSQYLVPGGNLFPIKSWNGTVNLNITNNAGFNSVAGCSGGIGGHHPTAIQNILNITLDTVVVTSSNFSITAYDFFTNMSLTNFTVNISGTYYPTINGTVNTALLQNATQLYTIQILSNESGGYFNRTETGVNVSSNKQYSMAQSVITFAAREKITNSSLAGFTFTTVNGSTTYAINGTQYMKASAYSVTASKANYWSKTQPVTVSALETATRTIENISATRLNLTLKDAITGATINSYSATFNMSTYGYSETASTTNGSLYIDLLNGTWTIDIDNVNYAITSYTQNLSVGMNNITLYIFATNSVYITFRDEQTNAIITTTPITVQLIGSYNSYQNTTSNGTTFLSLITPDSYTVRFNASSGYNTRFYYLNITNRSNTNITLYMLNSSFASNVTALVIDQQGRNVEAAYIYVLKYDITSNSYVLREIVITDVSGEAQFTAQLNQEYYKFLVYYPLGVLGLETTPAYIRSSTITLPISTTETAGTDFRHYLGVSGLITFNTTTNNFRYTYNDINGIIDSACVYVYRIYNNFTSVLYNQSCSSSTAGTILVGVNNITGSEYRADAYVYIDGISYLQDSKTQSFKSIVLWGSLGIFFAAVLSIVLFFAFKNPIGSLLATPLPPLAFTYFGLISWPIWIPWTIAILCVIAAVMISRHA